VIEFRTATPKDVTEYYGGLPAFSFKGMVAVEDGEVIGVGGVYRYAGVPLIFSERKGQMRKHLKARAKAVRILISFAESLGPVVYAVPDPIEPTAPYLLAKLGFKPTGKMTEFGELLVRRTE
jgi:hypothetical protein